ncbi:MAG: hypothetical protein DRQ47_08235 [Gammaproteobacteria bacterium]|nr:MAG: hypothetical protein DRQ47_08235 [Gammaproteobacteria bacterium]
MQHAKPKPGETKYGKLTKKQQNILAKVRSKEQKSNKEMEKIMRQSRFTRRCVDSRICPVCGSKLTYNENATLFNWFFPGSRKSTCVCDNCGFIYRFRNKTPMAPC